MLKIGIYQINTTVGALYDNTDEIISCLQNAQEGLCDLVVFHELTVCGYPPKDLVYQRGFAETTFKGVHVEFSPS